MKTSVLNNNSINLNTLKLNVNAKKNINDKFQFNKTMSKNFSSLNQKQKLCKININEVNRGVNTEAFKKIINRSITSIDKSINNDVINSKFYNYVLQFKNSKWISLQNNCKRYVNNISKNRINNNENTENEKSHFQSSNINSNTNPNSNPNPNNKNKNKQKKKLSFFELVKEYGIVATCVYFGLTLIIYFNTLGIILYYDLDADNLMKKIKELSERYSLKKEIHSKYHLKNKCVKEKDKKVSNNEIKFENLNEKIEKPITKEIHETKLEKVENKNDLSNQNLLKQKEKNSKQNLIKTMAMTFAITQIFSPIKMAMTIFLTPPIANFFKNFF